MKPIRVLIADDHALFREGVHAILKSVSDIEIVGEAGTGQEALTLAANLTPDVILMDIQMPDLNGVEATQRILKTQPDTGIIIVTMLEDDDSLFSAMRAGARGYVLKGADKAEMLKSIRAVAEGEALFGPAIATRLLNFFHDTPSQPKSKSPPTPFPELTEREREILTCIARGDTNDEIAERLSISLKTVRNHVSSIFNKLQVTNRAQAAIRARDAGLGE
ncbi:MAG: response regulator transcription factor [Anaerolineae bacterium]|nr:response regulator transcription factor [Anaerolineae bacterium]MCI0608326.1 response regulator transcription factor [Anaerolineae bacterium]